MQQPIKQGPYIISLVWNGTLQIFKVLQQKYNQKVACCTSMPMSTMHETQSLVVHDVCHCKFSTHAQDNTYLTEVLVPVGAFEVSYALLPLLRFVLPDLQQMV